MFINGRAHLSKEFSYHQHADDIQLPISILNGRMGDVVNVQIQWPEAVAPPAPKEEADQFIC